MVRPRNSGAFVLVALASALAGAGCRTEVVRPADMAGQVVVDECAERLHKLSRHLLTFYLDHGALPQTLDELRSSAAGDELPPLVCPRSGEPYLYRPGGPPAAGTSERVLICDSTPAHGGRRWAITVVSSNGRGPVVLNVIMLQESWAPARTAGG